MGTVHDAAVVPADPATATCLLDQDALHLLLAAGDSLADAPLASPPSAVAPLVGGKSLAAFREEAKKCVLVCANCHGEIEAGLIDCPPLGSRYRDVRFRYRCGGYGSYVTIGSSLFLIAAGAILRYAITADVDWININTAGLVLMVIGLFGLVLGLYFTFVRGEDPEEAVRRPPRGPVR
jgi:hypothetical protein